MPPLVLAALTIIGTLILVVVILGFVLAMFKRYAANQEQVARDRFPNAKAIISGASFFGQESLGAMQGRGNGTLVLTDSELYFERWLLKREYRIPLNAIQGIETPSSFLGKTRFTPLLKVVFRNANGQPDSIAWQVPDLNGLKRLLEESIQ